ncbi:unnamed protein product [Leptosia nina]|uniref:RNA-directed DNA polymerase n=1 Tax=Leptosia nina TaxID=320188 RepID=A0AAV1JJS0_9NEOP
MDSALLTDLLKAIRGAVSSNRRPDEDIALPVFDPTTVLCADGWCKNIEELAKEFGWSSLATVAKAGKALKGSALVWFESWQPSTEGRTWEKFQALIDTGANCSIIKESIAKRLQCNIEPYFLNLNGIGCGSLDICGKITVPVRFEDLYIELDILVVKDKKFNYDLLIGQNAVEYQDIEIITDTKGSKIRRKVIDSTKLCVNSVETHNTFTSKLGELLSMIDHLDVDLQTRIINIFKNHETCLHNSGSVSTGELTIKLKNNGSVHYRPYRLAPSEREKVNRIVNELLENNIIRESDSPFASPVILVKKKDGSDRLCVDYRSLNKIIEKDTYPLPLIEDQLDKLGKAKYFISIDMKNGFYQIPVTEDSIKYTAFSTPDGHYEFLKMPFGICNGPSVFQRAITKAVKHLNFLLVYIDDILIPFSTIDQGLEYLDKTISALSDSGFKVNLKKCKFFVESIEYLGRQISCEGIRPSETKVTALLNSPKPQTVKQVRQFMGLASYFRKFIPNFSLRTASISKLTKKNQAWEWGQEQNEARKYVLDYLVSKPLLSVFDPSLETELHTDASAIGYGAVLIQKLNNQTKVVAYYSKKTSTTESKYSSYDLETLAIFNSLKQFRVYLLGIKFKIITDCNSIKSTMNKKDLSPRVARLWTYMQDFDFDIIYKKGTYISHVDFLSRNPVETPLAGTINLINDGNSWLETAQQLDPITQILIDRVESGELDTNQYLVNNNLLYYKSKLNGEPKLYIPKSTRIDILRLFHDENCHVGFDKTFHKIREHFWFPGMAAFIRKYLSHCLICIKRKGHHGPKQGLLHPIEKAAIPFQTIHLDCMGPFTQSNEGYRHILLLVDGFTKFCLLKPLRTLSANELIPIIRDSITMFGSPLQVITDRGTNFSNNQIKNLFEELHIQHHMIATGTPRSNGQAERYVFTVCDMLNTMSNADELSDWPNVLWKVQQSINTTIQKSTGFSPLRLLIGVEANIPIIQSRLNDVVDNSYQVPINIDSDREMARQRLLQIAEKFKKRFDSTRRNNLTLQIGELDYERTAQSEVAGIARDDDDKDTYDMVMAFVVFRHGDRTPDQEELDKYPSSDLDSSVFFPYGKKALTNKGKQRAFRVGQYLRERYDDLISKLYLPDEISVRTTDFARTKMTMLTALSAMYPPIPLQRWHPEFSWQPIPYDTPHKYDDSMLHFVNCPRWEEAKDEVYTMPDVKRYLNESQEFFRLLSQYTKSDISTPEDVFYLDNLFQTLNNVDIQTPEWAQQMMPKIKETTKFEYMLMFYTDELIKLSAGGLLEDIFNATSGVIKGARSVPKLFLYSAHENNVAALLAATRTFMPHQPRYGSTVSLELWRNRMSGDYAFMVVYSPEAGGPGVVLPVNGCGGGNMCDYNTFIKLTKDYVLPHSEYKKWCSVAEFTEM